MTWLCYTFGPDKLMEWVHARRPGQALFWRALLASCMAWGWKRPWEKWIADERRWQEAILGEIRQNIR